ncbi:hypothetical protein WJX74_005407 [Apatococcus lobatus]|uniref:Uncharacterized protein n=1 Tax=Apatococcus lobatus TaxID=904363 RepID=A0AAW1QD48_9CHLO
MKYGAGLLALQAQDVQQRLTAQQQARMESCNLHAAGAQRQTKQRTFSLRNPLNSSLNLKGAEPAPHQQAEFGTSDAASASSESAALPDEPASQRMPQAEPAQQVTRGNALAEPMEKAAADSAMADEHLETVTASPGAAQPSPAEVHAGKGVELQGSAMPSHEQQAASQDAFQLGPADGHTEQAAGMPGSAIQGIEQQHPGSTYSTGDLHVAAATSSGKGKGSQHPARTAPWFTQPQAMLAEIGETMPANAAFISGNAHARQLSEAAMRAARGEDATAGRADRLAAGSFSSAHAGHQLQSDADGEAARLPRGNSVIGTAKIQLEATTAAGKFAIQAEAIAAMPQAQAAVVYGPLPAWNKSAFSEAVETRLQAAAAKRAARCAAMPSNGREVTPRDFQLDVHLAPEHSPSMPEPSLASEPLASAENAPQQRSIGGEPEPNLPSKLAADSEPDIGPAGNALQLSLGLQSAHHGTEAQHMQQRDGAAQGHERDEPQLGSVQTGPHMTPAGHYTSRLVHSLGGWEQQAALDLSLGMTTPMEGVLERETPQPAAGAQLPTTLPADACGLQQAVLNVAGPFDPQGPQDVAAATNGQQHEQEQGQKIDTAQKDALNGATPPQAASGPDAKKTPAGLPRPETGTPLPNFGLLPSPEVHRAASDAESDSSPIQGVVMGGSPAYHFNTAPSVDLSSPSPEHPCPGAEDRPQQIHGPAGSFSFGTPGADPRPVVQSPKPPLQPATPAAAHLLSPAGPPSHADSPWDDMLGPCPAPLPTQGSMSLPSDISDGFDDNDFFQDDLTSPFVHPLRQSHSSSPAGRPTLGLAVAGTAALPSPAQAAAVASTEPPSMAGAEAAVVGGNGSTANGQICPVGGQEQRATGNDGPEQASEVMLQQQVAQNDRQSGKEHTGDQHHPPADLKDAAAARTQPPVEGGTQDKLGSSADQTNVVSCTPASQHQEGGAAPSAHAAALQPALCLSSGEAPQGDSPTESSPHVDFSADCPLFAADIPNAGITKQRQAGRQQKAFSSSSLAKSKGHDSGPQAGGESRAAKKARRDGATQLEGSTHSARLQHATSANGLSDMPATGVEHQAAPSAIAEKQERIAAPTTQPTRRTRSGQAAATPPAPSAADQAEPTVAEGPAPTAQPTRKTRSGRTAAAARTATATAVAPAPASQPTGSIRQHHRSRAGMTRFSMECSLGGDFATPPTQIGTGGAEPLKGASGETPQESLDRYADAATPDPMSHHQQSAGMSSDDDNGDDGVMDDAGDMQENEGLGDLHVEAAEEAAPEAAGGSQPNAHPSGQPGNEQEAGPAAETASGRRGKRAHAPDVVAPRTRRQAARRPHRLSSSSLKGLGMCQEGDHRRSQRERGKPLEWWRNETKQYCRDPKKSIPYVEATRTRTPSTVWKRVSDPLRARTSKARRKTKAPATPEAKES